jgi:hypothetical protein
MPLPKTPLPKTPLPTSMKVRERTQNVRIVEPIQCEWQLYLQRVRLLFSAGKTRQDKTRQDKTRHDKTRQDKTRQDKTRQDKTRQDKTRQDKARQEDKTRQAETRRQDKTRRQNMNRLGPFRRRCVSLMVLFFLCWLGGRNTNTSFFLSALISRLQAAG